ncbi:MAG: hypothetical protein GF313_07780 [Caldithrix sp.]|nr:hypothetical protein [Caldithrix sp.]
MLEQFINTVLSNPLFIAVFVAVAILFVFFILKKLFRLAMGLGVLALGVIAIIYLTSDDPKGTINNVVNEGKKQLEGVSEEAEKISKDLKNQYDTYQEKKKGE